LEKSQALLTTAFSNISFQDYIQHDISDRDDVGNQRHLRQAKHRQLRDPFTGKLTSKGKELIQKGAVNFSPKELDSQLVYSHDPIDRPICSFELFPFFSKYLILWSKQLNGRFQLPRNKKFIHNHWEDIYRVYYKTQMKSLMERFPQPSSASTSTSSSSRPASSSAAVTTSSNTVNEYMDMHLLFYPKLLWTIIRDCFRFNLRFLGEFFWMMSLGFFLFLFSMKYLPFSKWLLSSHLIMTYYLISVYRKK
jgi:hypothetical protein